MSYRDQHVGDNCFKEDSPRPPVPGIETSPSVFGEGYSPSFRIKRESSPVHTPRRSNLAGQNASGEVVFLGYEPEGRCSSGGRCSPLELEHCSPPSYLCWARDLYSLLDDPNGVQLFLLYLEEEDSCHAEMLKFLLACRGLNDQEPELICPTVKAIHRKYIHKRTFAIPSELRIEVNKSIREGGDLLSSDIFDNVRIEVERRINEISYRNFLSSELYLQYVRSVHNGELSLNSPSGSGGSSGGGSPGGREISEASSGGAFLPTLHEEAELVTNTAHYGRDSLDVLHSNSQSLPLSQDILIATQKKQALELRPKPEVFVGRMHLPHAQYPIHNLPYISYVPNSRRDSEVQSLSSGGLSGSDASLAPPASRSNDGGHNRQSEKTIQPSKLKKENLNVVFYREKVLHPTIPASHVFLLKQCTYEEFSALLIQKLEKEKRKQDLDQQLYEKLEKLHSAASGETSCGKDDQEEESNQAILDKHCSIVFKTPCQTPGLLSPRPKSPECRRRGAALPVSNKGNEIVPAVSSVIPSQFASSAGPHQNMSHHHQSHSRSSYLNRHIRKDKQDVFSSTFSFDSGNYHDFQEESDSRHYSNYVLPKSKSMPEYQDSGSYSPSTGHDLKYKEMSRKSNKKASVEFDSGVSVISGSTPVPPVQSAQYKGKRVQSWLVENEKLTEREKYMLRGTSSGGTATSPTVQRHSRRPSVPYNGSRSGSLERNVGSTAAPWTGVSSQTEISTGILSDAGRCRLEEDSRSKTARLRTSSSGKPLGMNMPFDTSSSSHSTLRKSSKYVRQSSTSNETATDFTIAVISFCDEPVPYRIRIPVRPVSLRRFKEALPKKGSYRYFFKTNCENGDISIIHEEITEEDEIVPLFEGKIMAQVKVVD